MDSISTLYDFLTTQLVGFAVGVCASFVSAIAYQYWKQQQQWKEYRSLLGTWIETNNRLEDRPFSICDFSVSRTGNLRFEGHSYDNDGKEYYKWWSVTEHIDDCSNRFSYVYETQRVGVLDKDEGFGCIFLRKDANNSEWLIERGYFLDLSEAVARHAQMVRFNTVADHLKLNLNSHRQEDRRLIIKALIKNKDNKSMNSVLGLQ